MPRNGWCGSVNLGRHTAECKICAHGRRDEIEQDFIKEQLRIERPEDEWKLWVRPTYLLRVMDHHHLLLVMPPNNAIIEAASKRKPPLKAKLAEYGFTFGFAPYPDDWQRYRLGSQGWEISPKRKPQCEASV